MKNQIIIPGEESPEKDLWNNFREKIKISWDEGIQRSKRIAECMNIIFPHGIQTKWGALRASLISEKDKFLYRINRFWKNFKDSEDVRTKMAKWAGPLLIGAAGTASLWAMVKGTIHQRNFLKKYVDAHIRFYCSGRIKSFTKGSRILIQPFTVGLIPESMLDPHIIRYGKSEVEQFHNVPKPELSTLRKTHSQDDSRKNHPMLLDIDEIPNTGGQRIALREIFNDRSMIGEKIYFLAFAEPYGNKHGIAHKTFELRKLGFKKYNS